MSDTVVLIDNKAFCSYNTLLTLPKNTNGINLKRWLQHALIDSTQQINVLIHSISSLNIALQGIINQIDTLMFTEYRYPNCDFEKRDVVARDTLKTQIESMSKNINANIC